MIDVQAPMGRIQRYQTDVDLIFCIDCTESMAPVINTVKNLVKNLFDDVEEAMSKGGRPVRNFRTKIISFRDYYCEGAIDDALTRGQDYNGVRFSMWESRFYELPDENQDFTACVDTLDAAGGGDEPENALEALALAMKRLHEDGCEVYSGNERKRHIVVMFTDASAHELEKSRAGKPKVYPEDMLADFKQIKEAWEGISQERSTENYVMDSRAKRLVVFAPLDSYPWSEIGDWSLTTPVSIEPAMGGRELDKQAIIDTLVGSMT